MSDEEKTTASQEKLLGSRDWPGDVLKEQPVSLHLLSTNSCCMWLFASTLCE